MTAWPESAGMTREELEALTFEDLWSLIEREKASDPRPPELPIEAVRAMSFEEEIAYRDAHKLTPAEWENSRRRMTM